MGRDPNHRIPDRVWRQAMSLGAKAVR